MFLFLHMSLIFTLEAILCFCVRIACPCFAESSKNIVEKNISFILKETSRGCTGMHHQ